MCANYKPPMRLEIAFNALPATFDYSADMYPGHRGPMLLADPSGRKGDLIPYRATFGILPHWAKPRLARQTYNARSETVEKKPSFRNAWARRQFCLIPVQGFYEPNYESGKPVRWIIQRKDAKPFALAGIYEAWTSKDTGETVRSFSMLTINAEACPLMSRFHAPDDEKRSVVVIEPELYVDWLSADCGEAARVHLRLMDSATFEGRPDPRPLSVQRAP